MTMKHVVRFGLSIMVLTVLTFFHVGPAFARHALIIQTAPQFTAKGTTALPTSVSPGQLETISVNITSSVSISGINVLIDVYDSTGKEVTKQPFDNLNFTAGQTRNFSYPWTMPAGQATGTYSVSVGVFDSTWAKSYLWLDKQASFSVSLNSPAPTPAPTPTPTPTATPTPTLAAPSISTSATTVAPGGALVATVKNGPADPSDWVGLYPVGSALDYPLGNEWKYMNGTQTLPASGIGNATLGFNAWTTAGQYEFRVYDGVTQALVATSATITVQGTAPSPTSAPAPAPTSVPTSNLLFYSNFGPGVSVGAPYGYDGVEAWADITGMDQSTGFSWPMTLWGSHGGEYDNGLQLLTGYSFGSSNVNNIFQNQIQSVTGPSGTPTYALYQNILQSNASAEAGYGPTQDPLMIENNGGLNIPGDVYISEWIKFQPNLQQQLGFNGDNWRAFFEWKTGNSTYINKDDYRLAVYVMKDNSGNLFWHTHGNQGNNVWGPYVTYWQAENHTVPVPQGQWFHFELFWHRGSNHNDNSGRVWQAINGQTIVDVNHVTFPNNNTSMMGVGNLPIDRIMLMQNYSGGTTPCYQWVTDIQIYSTFPPTASPH